MNLESERLILRECEMRDKQVLFDLFTEKHVRVYDEYMPSDMDGVEKYIQYKIENAKSDNQTHFNYIFELKETGEVVGVAGYFYVDESIYELEYFAREKFWNQGYMTEAVSRILEYVRLNHEKVKKIFAICQTENKNSERVMIKCGMKKSTEQPQPKKYHGVYKERVRYEINF